MVVKVKDVDLVGRDNDDGNDDDEDAETNDAIEGDEDAEYDEDDEDEGVVGISENSPRHRTRLNE